MRSFYFFILSIALFSGISCKKNNSQSPPVSLAIDPIANESFGTRLTVSGKELLQSPVWSQDSRMLFLKTEEGVFTLSIASARLEQLLNQETNAFMVQSTPDNQSAIFLGTINSSNGFYAIDLSDKHTTELLRFSTKQTAMVHVGTNDMFYYKADLISVGRPCESWDDIFCGVHQEAINIKYGHKKFDNNSDVSIPPDLTFKIYSNDGSKAIFTRNYGLYTCFVYNVMTQSFEDSSTITSGFISVPFHWNNNTARFAYIENGTSDIVIADMKSNREINRFHSSLILTDSYLTWPEKSNKIFYAGYCNSNECTYSINELDLNTMTERKLVTTSYTEVHTSAFNLHPSPDGTILVFSDGYATYLKEIN